jgi:hypothetical protein
MIFFLITIKSTAQSIEGFGVKFGLTSANTSFKLKYWQYDDNETKTGFNVAIFKDCLIDKTFFLSPIIQYSQKGFLHAYESGKVRLDILSIDILGKYKIDIGNNAIYFAIGPRVDILLNVQSSIIYLANTSYYIYWNSSNTYKDHSLGSTISAGFELFSTSDNQILFDLTYNQDFSNNLNGNNEIFESIKNHSIDFNLGIIF